jgi:hypothetical protein
MFVRFISRTMLILALGSLILAVSMGVLIAIPASGYAITHTYTLSSSTLQCYKNSSGQFLNPAVDPYQIPALKQLLGTLGSSQHTLVDEAWCVALSFGISPTYFISQIYAESSFKQSSIESSFKQSSIESSFKQASSKASSSTTITALGLTQISVYALEPGTYLNTCMFSVLRGKASPECTNGSSNFGSATSDTLEKYFGGPANVENNLIAGARFMLGTVLDNLPQGSPTAKDPNSLNPAMHNAVVQACAHTIYTSTVRVNGLSTPVDCMELYAKALVAYNGGQDVVSGDGGNPYNGCNNQASGAPWLLCIYHEQDHRYPNSPNDGNRPDTYEWQHEAGHYVVNITYSLFVTTDGSDCNADANGNPDPSKEPICLSEINGWPQNAKGLISSLVPPPPPLLPPPHPRTVS